MTDQLERELKKALEPVHPPAGFAERVLARAAHEENSSAARRTWVEWFRTGGLRWAMTGALCATLVGSGIAYRHERERRGREAKEQLMLALRITSSKLQIATESMQEMNSPVLHRQ